MTVNYGLASMNLGAMVADCVEDSHKWFPGAAQTVPNLVLCLAGEVGEVANIVKKIERGSIPSYQHATTLPEEIVDVLIYLCNIMGHEAFKNIDWQEVWTTKRRFNQERFGKDDA